MKIGNQTIKLKNTPKILETSCIVGKKEKEGPLGDYFDLYNNDIFFGKDTFEKAESEMMSQCINNLLSKTGTDSSTIDYVFAGDLLNQCISSGYAIRDLQIPFLGLYGACSTFAESTLLSSLLINANYATKVIAATSSHFCSAERQFRLPLEHGNQKTPTAQITVTGSGSCLLVPKDFSNTTGAYITYVTPGKIIDYRYKGYDKYGRSYGTCCF